MAAVESRTLTIPGSVKALLGCTRAVIRGQLSGTCGLHDDLLHRFADRRSSPRQIGHGRISCISEPVTLIGHAVAPEGGNIPFVRSGIPHLRNMPALLRRLLTHPGALIADLLAALMRDTAAAVGQVAIGRVLILVGCRLVAIRCSLVNRSGRLPRSEPI